MSANAIDAPAIGDVMPGGSIYAGVSPDTGRPMYTTPKDAPLACTFNGAAVYASKLDAHGHRDWRVPMEAELNVLFQNRAAIGNFDTSGSTAGWHWSSSQYDGYNAWGQHFSDGNRSNGYKGNQSPLRCVRG
jgi:hypothetical protein